MTYPLSSIAAITTMVAMAAAVGLSPSPSASAFPPQGGAQAGPPQGEPVAGISCDAMEGAILHIHQHLVVFDHGKQIAIPPNVGQHPARRCLYWVHTHTPDGIVHIESPTKRTFTLGDFFMIWGQPLTKTQASIAKADKGTSLKIWVNGKPYTGDPRQIQMTAHADIVIEAGPPFPKPPVFTNWGSL